MAPPAAAALGFLTVEGCELMVKLDLGAPSWTLSNHPSNLDLSESPCQPLWTGLRHYSYYVGLPGHFSVASIASIPSLLSRLATPPLLHPTAYLKNSTKPVCAKMPPYTVDCTNNQS